MVARRTAVAVVGAGPAGLTVANLLRRAGIGCVLLEQESRAFIEQRPRAGVIEEGGGRGGGRRAAGRAGGAGGGGGAGGRRVWLPPRRAAPPPPPPGGASPGQLH